MKNFNPEKKNDKQANIKGFKVEISADLHIEIKVRAARSGETMKRFLPKILEEGFRSYCEKNPVKEILSSNIEKYRLEFLRKNQPFILE